MRRIWIPGVVLWAGLAVGCAGPAAETRGFQSRRIDAPDVQAVLREGRLILQRDFGGVSAEPGGARLVSAEHEYNASTGSGSTRDLYGAPSRLRRQATLTAMNAGGAVIARVRVEVDREDTLANETVGREAYRLSDTPGYTPIERDASRTDVQNKSWTFVRRDLAQEREILTELQERFAGVAAPAAPPPEAEEATPASAPDASPPARQ